MRIQVKAALLIAATFTFPACKDRGSGSEGAQLASDAAAPANTDGVSARSLQFWNQHVAQAEAEAQASLDAATLAKNADALQPGCKPRHVPHQGTYRGLVILFHGFTACPQQFVEWAEQDLAPAGFDVFLPVLPGHGYARHSNGKDNYEHMPNVDDYAGRFGPLADLMASVAHATPQGLHVIGGLSLGGAAAIQASMAIAPDQSFVFERQLFLVPLLEVGGYTQTWIPIANSFVSKTAGSWWPLRNQPHTWDDNGGSSCADSMNPALTQQRYGREPRYGYCTFNGYEVNGARYYGHDLLAKLDQTKYLFGGATQVVTLQNDPAADTGTTRTMIDKLRRGPARISDCAMPTGVNHSMLSRYDAPEETKFWLNDLRAALTRFVVGGVPLPSTEEVLDSGFHKCVLTP